MKEVKNFDYESFKMGRQEAMSHNTPSAKTLEKFDDLSRVIGSLILKSEKGHTTARWLLYINLFMLFVNIVVILLSGIYLTSKLPVEINKSVVSSMNGLELMIVE